MLLQVPKSAELDEQRLPVPALTFGVTELFFLQEASSISHRLSAIQLLLGGWFRSNIEQNLT